MLRRFAAAFLLVAISACSNSPFAPHEPDSGSHEPDSGSIISHHPDSGG